MTSIDILILSYLGGKRAGLTFEECDNLRCQLSIAEGRATAVDSLIRDCKALLNQGGDLNVQTV